MHADTCVLGRNFIRLHNTMQTASVTPYTLHYEAVHDITVVTATTAIQLTLTGRLSYW